MGGASDPDKSLPPEQEYSCGSMSAHQLSLGSSVFLGATQSTGLSIWSNSTTGDLSSFSASFCLSCQGFVPRLKVQRSSASDFENVCRQLGHSTNSASPEYGARCRLFWVSSAMNGVLAGDSLG